MFSFVQHDYWNHVHSCFWACVWFFPKCNRSRTSAGLFALFVLCNLCMCMAQPWCFQCESLNCLSSCKHMRTLHNSDWHKLFSPCVRRLFGVMTACCLAIYAIHLTRRRRRFKIADNGTLILLPWFMLYRAPDNSEPWEWNHWSCWYFFSFGSLWLGFMCSSIKG